NTTKSHCVGRKIILVSLPRYEINGRALAEPFLLVGAAGSERRRLAAVARPAAQRPRRRAGANFAAERPKGVMASGYWRRFLLTGRRRRQAPLSGCPGRQGSGTPPRRGDGQRTLARALCRHV